MLHGLVLQSRCGHFACSSIIKRQALATGSLKSSAGSLKSSPVSFTLSRSASTAAVHSQPKPRRKLLWLALGAAVGGFAFVKVRGRSKGEDEVKLAKNWEVSLYRKLPLRSMSRAWGKFNDITLPSWSRKPLLSLYIRLFGCKLEEAAVEDLKHYKNLGEFFKRALKPGVRPLDSEHTLVLPSDGKVLNFGEIDNGAIEQVKGVTYSLKGFFGPNNQHIYEDMNMNNNSTKPLSDLEFEARLRRSDEEVKQIPDSQFYNSVLHNKDNRLYHIVVYLAPGDYHRFHSPAEWVVEHRRHFPGDLLSVNPMIARWVQGLFNFNERAVYTGRWRHGFFSMTAVGATNVGSIRTYFDQDLVTNLRKDSGKDPTYNDLSFAGGVPLRKGELFGEFNLGSTIVLVFEAPKDFQFSDISLNQTVKMGEGLGDRQSDRQSEYKEHASSA